MRASVLAPFSRAARGLGLDPRALIEAAGLPAAAIQAPDMPLAAIGVIRLLEASARAAGREDFGLLVADAIDLTLSSQLGLLMRQQPTVGDALAVYAHYQRHTGNTVILRVEAPRTGQGRRRSGSDPAEPAWAPLALLHATLRGAPRPGDPVAIDLALGCALAILRALLGEDWRPILTGVTRTAPADPLPYLDRFGAVAFEQNFNGVVIPVTDLDRPMPEADREAARATARMIEARGGIDSAISEQLNPLITELLPTGGCTIEEMAERLGVDRRTIHRRLAQEGESFTGLVEKRRRALVIEHLSDQGRPLKVVAEQLGFSSLSTFSRWYRQAHGGTARAFRGALEPRSAPGRGRTKP